MPDPVVNFETVEYLDASGQLLQAVPGWLAERDRLVELYRVMLLTRIFDKAAINLQRTGAMGTYPSGEGQDRVLVVLGDPLVAAGLEVDAVQRRFGALKVVEGSDQPLDPPVLVILEEVPAELLVVVPLVRHRELAAHEQQRLAGHCPLVAVQEPQVGAVRIHFVQMNTVTVAHVVPARKQDFTAGQDGRIKIVALVVGYLLNIRTVFVHDV